MKIFSINFSEEIIMQLYIPLLEVSYEIQRAWADGLEGFRG